MSLYYSAHYHNSLFKFTVADPERILHDKNHRVSLKVLDDLNYTDEFRVKYFTKFIREFAQRCAVGVGNGSDAANHDATAVRYARRLHRFVLDHRVVMGKVILRDEWIAAFSATRFLNEAHVQIITHRLETDTKFIHTTNLPGYLFIYFDAFIRASCCGSGSGIVAAKILEVIDLPTRILNDYLQLLAASHDKTNVVAARLVTGVIGSDTTVGGISDGTGVPCDAESVVKWDRGMVHHSLSILGGTLSTGYMGRSSAVAACKIPSNVCKFSVRINYGHVKEPNGVSFGVIKRDNKLLERFRVCDVGGILGVGWKLEYDDDSLFACCYDEAGLLCYHTGDDVLRRTFGELKAGTILTAEINVTEKWCKLTIDGGDPVIARLPTRKRDDYLFAVTLRENCSVSIVN